MTRIAVTSDLHVDDFGTRRGASGLNARFEDMLGTVRWVAREAKARGADVLVVAGDYTESKVAARSPRVVKIAAALAEGPARQVHIRGNHDQEWAGESIVTDLARTPGWTGFGQPGIELVGDVAICAVPFLDRAWYRAQPGKAMLDDATAFRELAEAYVTIARGLYAQAVAAGARAAILVGHQQIAGGQMTDRQRAFLGDLDLVVDSRALAAIGYAAVVFGHVHRAQTVVEDPDCPVLYVGSPERVDFAEEHEAKSFVVVDVDAAGRASIERIPTPARRFVTLTGDELRNDHALGAAHVRDAVVRVLDLDPAIDVASVRRELTELGAFEVTEIRRAKVETAAAAGGMDESLSPEALLREYFADDPDAGALVDRGRQILAEVAA